MKNLKNAQTIPSITLKAALLDCITYKKFGTHLAPNFGDIKKQICSILGVSDKITNEKYLSLIGEIYQYNKQSEIYFETFKKFKL